MDLTRRVSWLGARLSALLGIACATAEIQAGDVTKPAATAAPESVPSATRATGTGQAGFAPAASPLPAEAEAADPEPEQRGAVVVGSSSVSSTFGRIIAADLEQWGFEVTRRGVVSAGLARPDFCDLHAVIDSLPIDEDTAAVFVYVGMNDGQAIWLRPGEREEDGSRWLGWRDPRWSSVYTRRARNLFRSICERGARRAIVMLPVEVERSSLERKMQRIRRLQRQAARDAPCARAISTLGNRGKFSDDGEPLRLSDGFHMSPRGAQMVWDRVQQRAALRLAPLGARSVPQGNALSAAPAVRAPAARRPSLSFSCSSSSSLQRTCRASASTVKLP